MDRYIKYALAGIPLSAGLLYLAGIIYDSSYFAFWGLDSELFPRSVNDTIVRGVLALLSVGAKHSFTLMVIAFISFAIVIALNWLIDWLGLREVSHSTEARVGDRDVHRIQQAKENSISSGVGSIELTFGILTLLASAFFVLTLVMAVLTSGLTTEGDESARRRYDQLLSEPWSGESIYDVSIIDSDIAKMPRRMITCSTTLCVFLTPAGVETVNRELITKMRSSVKLKNKTYAPSHKA